MKREDVERAGRIRAADAGAPGVVLHADAGAFRARGEQWLMKTEDEHNLVLGLSAALVGADPGEGEDRQLWATVEADGHVVGCAFRTPPHKLGLTRMPVEAAAVLAREAATLYRSLPAAFGPTEVAQAFGRAWNEVTGASWTPGLPQRMYRLDEVVHPVGVAGTLRPGTEADLPTAHQWADDFARDAGHGFMTPPAARERWIRQRELYFWDVGGAPVSMAVATGWTPGGARIGYVFTPRDRRGRGYASALTAAVSQRILDGGRRFCVLYTDATSRVPNAIYPRVGYRHLVDLADVNFS
jgi:hypothetical protein